jgi:hypothetical protein
MTNHIVAPPKLAYSINEAIAATSIKRTKLYELLADPDCPLRAVRIGGRTLIPAESLHALITGEA